MLRRCKDETFKDWYLYGGAGVTVCERWHEYDAFAADMGPRPSKSHSVDRKDGKQGYHPDNCRWATPTEQARNAITNRMIEHNGEVKTLAAWAEQLGIKYVTLFQRLKRGWSMEKSGLPIGDPRAKRRFTKRTKLAEYAGDVLPMSEMAAKYNITKSTLQGRLRTGWTMERALTTPQGKPVAQRHPVV